MNIDPKLKAPKVVPIDRVRESYDEDDDKIISVHSIPDPVYLPRDFLVDICGIVGASTVLLAILYVLYV